MQGQDEHGREALPADQLAQLNEKKQERKNPEVPGLFWWGGGE